jgi:plasmid maintenance system antidote protein VapI
MPKRIGGHYHACTAAALRNEDIVRLSEQLSEQLSEKLTEHLTYSELARQFGLTPERIRQIVRGRREWARRLPSRG